MFPARQALWPEPHSNTPWNSYVKDQLEDRLHRLVCEHKEPLEQAQRDIARNWISAYKEYYRTDRPLARVNPSGTTELGSSALIVPTFQSAANAFGSH
jgi:hypothetical protein